MAELFQRDNLRPDEFAFYFSSDQGIEARELGQFLQRAATVAGRQDAEIRVVAIHDGSLAVVCRTLAKRIGREFSETPVKTSAAAVTLTTAVVGAIILAMSPKPGKITPLAKAGAELVEDHRCDKIEIVTNKETTLVMDKGIAGEVRLLDLPREQTRLIDSPPRLESLRIRQLMNEVKSGGLSGTTAILGSELHFRPDGFRFWVPVDMDRSGGAKNLVPGAHFEITGEILLRAGQPDSIVIHRANRI